MSCVARVRGDEADGAVQMLAVVPFCEGFYPSLRISLCGKPLGRPVRAVFAGSEQSFRDGLPLLTRGRLQEAVMPSCSIVVFIVTPFIGLPSIGPGIRVMSQIQTSHGVLAL